MIFQLNSISWAKNGKWGTESIASVVEQLTKDRAGVGPSGLLSVNSIEGLVGEETDSGVEETPGGDCTLEWETIVEESEGGGEEDEPADEGDQVGSHPHG